MTEQPNHLTQADAAREAYQYFMRTESGMTQDLAPVGVNRIKHEHETLD